MKRIVIIGGGIAGTSLAWRLESAGVDVTLLERRERLGGVIETVREEDFLIEGGPDSFVTMKPWGKTLCEELGIGGGLRPLARPGFFVRSRGKLHRFPAGVLLSVPTKILPFLFNSLLSFRSKMRMGLDLILPRGPEVEDESLADFVLRRFGREALEKVAEPVMAGIFVAPADQLSLQTTFPQFAKMERDHRSLIRAFRKHRRHASGGSPFLTLEGGMDGLVRALESGLKKTKVITGCAVDAIEPGWRIIAGAETTEADAVVLAVPASEAARLVRPFDPSLSDRLGTIRATSTATCSLAYRQEDIPHDLDGTGFVIPRKERETILACTWSSRKFDGRAPEGKILLRCFLGGVGMEHVFERNDDELVRTAREDLERTLGITADPLLHRLFRWPNANPVYEVGHLKKVQEIDRNAPDGLHFLGSPYHGLGIPDCVRDAGELGDRLAARDHK